MSADIAELLSQNERMVALLRAGPDRVGSLRVRFAARRLRGGATVLDSTWLVALCDELEAMAITGSLEGWKRSVLFVRVECAALTARLQT